MSLNPPHQHGQPAYKAAIRALTAALVLNGGFLIIEAGLGWWTGSLALLSDAAHMVSDVGALILALGATHLAQRAASPNRSFGFMRAETLGAFVNGLALVVACGFIFYEAIDRLTHGAPHVQAWPVLAAGIVGLAINLGSAWALHRADGDNINIRGALLHMMADALGSAGAIAAAVFLWFGIQVADSIISLFIGALVLWGAWRLLREATYILLQFAPAGVKVHAVEEALRGIEGVADVHELHCWTLDGQEAILSAHIVGDKGTSPTALRTQAEALLHETFGVHHTTLQVECEAPACCEQPGCPLASRVGTGHHHHGHAHGHGHGHGHDHAHH